MRLGVKEYLDFFFLYIIVDNIKKKSLKVKKRNLGKYFPMATVVRCWNRYSGRPETLHHWRCLAIVSPYWPEEEQDNLLMSLPALMSVML